jgi:hypothetical protein
MTFSDKIKSIRQELGVVYVKPSFSKLEDLQNALNESKEALEYLNIERGLTNETIKHFKLGYDKTAELIKQGRYNSLFNELGADYEKGLSVWLPQVMKKTALFALDVATFGNTNMLKVNENRAKAMFEQYLSKNPHLLTSKSKDELYKEFLEYKKGNLKATASELFMVFGLLLALAGLGKYWDDDSYERRTSMRLLRRVTRELSFFVNPQSVQETAGRGVVPLLGILQDIQKLGFEVYDESTDLIIGEDNDKDKIGILYRARPFIPGAKLTMVYETFDEDEKRKY